MTASVLSIGPLEERLEPLAPKDQATPAPLGTRCINPDTVVNQSCLLTAVAVQGTGRSNRLTFSKKPNFTVGNSIVNFYCKFRLLAAPKESVL